MSSNAGIAPTSARVRAESEQTEVYSDLSPSRERGATFPALDWLFGPLLSFEGRVDASLGWCETGGLLSFLRVGAELRCGVLQQDAGAPFSLALSGAATYAIDFGDVYSSAGLGGWRTGIDASIRAGRFEPLLGAYVDRGTQRRELVDDRLPQGTDLFDHVVYGTVVAERDEWRVAMPLGVSFIDPDRRGTLALVPEYTLSARLRSPPVLRAATSGVNTVESFTQHWALFLTGSLELTL